VPVLASFVGGPRVRPGAAALEELGIPCYPFPERAVRALATMVRLAERRLAPSEEPAVALDVAPALAHVEALARAGRTRLGLLEAAPLLAAAGIPLCEARFARTPGDVAHVAASLGSPVALKIVSAQISHKTDVGGVALGLDSPEAARTAAVTMHARVTAARPDAVIDGFLVQRMAPPAGVEMLLGAVRDPQFGPVVMVGVGGIHVEIFDDTATRLAPIDRDEARRMLDELRLAPVLRGARGRPAVDVAAVADALVRLGALMRAVPRLAELELNPLIATSHGVMGLDARGVLT
jgi:acetyltransferase